MTRIPYPPPPNPRLRPVGSYMTSTELEAWADWRNRAGRHRRRSRWQRFLDYLTPAARADELQAERDRRDSLIDRLEREPLQLPADGVEVLIFRNATDPWPIARGRTDAQGLIDLDAVLAAVPDLELRNGVHVAYDLTPVLRYRICGPQP